MLSLEMKFKLKVYLSEKEEELFTIHDVKRFLLLWHICVCNKSFLKTKK